MNVIFSIKPQYADQIVAGTKRFEYRKRGLLREVERAFIYSTSPVKKIIGEFTIKKIHSAHPLEIWERTYEAGGISAIDYLDYFVNSEIAYAIEVDSVVKYAEPIAFNVLDPTGKVPQSFKYLSKEG